MTAIASPSPIPRARVDRRSPSTIVGYVLSGIASAFLAFDGISKIMRVSAVTDAMQHLGYPPALAPTLGTILLISLIVYMIPRTAVLGALLLTAYLGGAVSTQLRIGAPLLGFVLFPVYMGLFVWGGLFLRDARLRALLPLRDTRA